MLDHLQDFLSETSWASVNRSPIWKAQKEEACKQAKLMGWHLIL